MVLQIDLKESNGQITIHSGRLPARLERLSGAAAMVYNAQVHQATSLTSLHHLLSQHTHGCTTFNASSARMPDKAGTKSSHALQTRLPHWLATMPQNADNRMRPARQHLTGHHERRTCHALQPLNDGNYLYIDPPPMKFFAIQQLEPNW